VVITGDPVPAQPKACPGATASPGRRPGRCPRGRAGNRRPRP